MERCLQRVRQTALHALADDETIHDDLNRVLLLLFERDLLAEIMQLPVDAHAHISLAANLFEHLLVLALLAAHELRHDEELCSCGQLHDPIHHLIDALLCDRLATVRAVRASRARIEQAQIVVDLRHRPDRRARIVTRRLLVNRDGGRQPLDVVHIGLVHLPKELPRVGRQRLHVAALPLGVDCIKCERGLPRAGEPRHHN